MPEFLVQMNVRFVDDILPEEIDILLEREALACQPYFENGEFERAWMTWGTHFGDHGHAALWNAPSRQYVWDIYVKLPLVREGFGTDVTILDLNPNPNDPGTHPLLMAESPIPLTYGNLIRFLGIHGEKSDVTNEGATATLTKGVTIHDHPMSGRPREIHFMVSGQKVAEIGPPSKALHGSEDVAPGYVDLLVEWDGRPVHHDAWKNRILADNGLLYSDYESARKSPRLRRSLAGNP